MFAREDCSHAILCLVVPIQLDLRSPSPQPSPRGEGETLSRSWEPTDRDLIQRSEEPRPYSPSNAIVIPTVSSSGRDGLSAAPMNGAPL